MMRDDGQSLGVIFDMDGVLVDSRAAHLESWRRLAAELGAHIAENEFDRTFGRTSRDIIAMLFGGGRGDDEVRRLDDRKEAMYRDLIRGAVPAMPGAVELVAALHDAGFALGIGSSGPPQNVALVSAGMGLDRWIDGTVSGADVSRGKPDPQVFLLAAERIGRPPRHCAVIEDAPVGIEAARRAGCTAIALCSTHPAAAFAEADLVVQRLSDLDVGRIRAAIRV